MRQADEDFDAELRFHLESLEQEHRARGLSPADARLAALRDLGGIARTKQAYREQRGLPWLETLWQDIRFGLRSLRRTPGVTGAVILTLMLGIGANTALFSVIYTVLLKPLPYRNPERLVWIGESNNSRRAGFELVPISDVIDWRSRSRSLTSIAAVGLGEDTLTANGESERIWVVAMSESTESSLGVAPAMGRGFLPEELKPGAPRVALLSDRLFRRRFGGDGSIFGKTIALSGQPHTVVGILPPGFRLPLPVTSSNPPVEAEIIVNSPLDPSEPVTNGVIGRLNPGVKLETARAELSALLAASKKLSSTGSRGRELRMVPLLEQVVGGSRAALLILWAAVGFVLLVACVNVTNLLLARSATRARETAIRMALGAGRIRLIRHLLTESLLLAFAGGAAGLLLAFWGLRAVVAIAPLTIPRLRDASLDWKVLLFSAAVCAITGILSGIMPALSSTHARPEEALKQGARTVSAPGRRQRLHGALVVCELALALVLLAGAGLMLKSLWVMNSGIVLYAPDRVLSTRIEARNLQFAGSIQERRRFLEETLRQIESLSGVRAAAVFIHVLGGAMELPELPNRASADMLTDQRIVTPHYFRSAGLRLLAGREFGDRDREGAPPVAIVNEAYVRMYSLPDNASILGREIRSVATRGQPDPTPITIIGVVSDFRSRPDTDAGPQVYWALWQNIVTTSTMLYVRTSVDPLTMAGAIRKIATQSPEVSMVGVQTLEEEMSTIIAPRRFQAALLATFAALALLLALVGTYGVLSYAVTERTHEIGVRMALGAGDREVLRMVLARGARLALTGAGLGLAASAVLTRWMSSLLYGVKPTDPWTFIVVCVLLVAVALLAAYLPARRAVSMDPMVALRVE